MTLLCLERFLLTFLGTYPLFLSLEVLKRHHYMKRLGSRLLLLFVAFFTCTSAYLTKGGMHGEIYLPYMLLSSVKAQLSSNTEDAFAEEKLASFQGRYANKAISLTWKIESPKKGTYYMIQRSADGHQWFTLGGIAIRENHQLAQTYEMIDKDLDEKFFFYKLKEIDPDGNIIFSKNISVYTSPERRLAIFPNPVDTAFDLKFSIETQESIDLTISNTNGQEIARRKLSPSAFSQTVRVDVSDFPPGVYIVSVSTQEERFVGRMLKK